MSDFFNLDFLDKFEKPKLTAMKKIIVFFLPFIFSFTVHATSIVNPKDPSADQIMVPLGDGPYMISLSDYINLSPKEYRNITGHKLSLKEKIKLKLTQSILKKAMKKTGFNKEYLAERGLFDEWSWHWGGFALGFFLSIIGVIIALFINDDYRTDRFRTALLTAGIMAGILAAIAAAFAAP